ncbi:sporulation protein [Catellatospora methionotrophica]|uniref:sporulation protein n=1 Tax=Catellatospora methionotrophica TaxID=121620 RepID=UPI0033F66ADC
MVLRRILSSLGFGGVDVDTVLTTPVIRPGGAFSGQVRLHARGDVDITSVQLLLVASSGGTQVELGRYAVAERLALFGGAGQAVGFHLAAPYSTPFTLVYGQPMPGVNVGVRTEVTVTQGSAKTDFDALGVEPTEITQYTLDALGTIGSRFVRSELRPGSPVTQAITFYAPVPQGQPVGPHVPQLVFTLAADPQGLTVTAEVAGRPGPGDVHRVPEEQFRALVAQPAAWIELVDGWVRRALDRVAALPDQDPGSFMRPPVQAGPAAPGQARKPYAYPAQAAGGYRYGGYRGAGTLIGAGLGGAALGFLGGMVIGDMIHDAVTPDADADTADAQDPGTADTYADTGDAAQAPDAGSGYEAGGYDPGGYDAGGFDSGGFGDFGDF